MIKTFFFFIIVAGGVGAAVTWLFAITSPTYQERPQRSHQPPCLMERRLSAWERKANYPPPIFTFWPFELWPALPLPGVKGGGYRRPPALHPLSITWTLSHCSCHPKNNSIFIWELSWLYQPTNKWKRFAQITGSQTLTVAILATLGSTCK